MSGCVVTPVKVEVEGLKQLRRELERAGELLPKELRAANRDAAGLVAPEVRRRAPRGPHEGGGRYKPISESVRVLGTQLHSSVAIGGALSPAAKVYEFGGSIPRFHSQQRTRIKARPFAYPALAAMQDRVVDHYGAVLDHLLAQVFPR